jgi:hypothetical protein
MDQQTKARFDELAPLANAIWKRLKEECLKQGIEPDAIPLGSPQAAVYRLERDPSNGLFSLIGEWRNPQGMKQGEILFHPDGSFFAEHDIALPHPKKPKWFLEAITAWGRGEEIKSEPRLLPMPE